MLLANKGSASGAREIFHRPALAQRIAKQVLNASPTSATSSGIFLSSPRRTGKTTFKREDLAPALRAQGALVVYVDLWANPKADPSNVIVSAIKAELQNHEKALTQLARKFATASGKSPLAEFPLDCVGLGKEISLVHALSALSDATSKVIVLILDEAQHAITTAAGNEAMFVLKSARDELNSQGHFGLRLVCSGSNRDKLAMLRNTEDQAFFGAPLVPFPALGKDYIAWFCEHANDFLGEEHHDHIYELFTRAGHRPEVLGAAADQVRFDFELDHAMVKERFSSAVEEQLNSAIDDMVRVIHNLPPIQSAVLRVLAASGSEFAPFEAATMAKYRLSVERNGDNKVKVEVTTVQQALGALQEKGLIWRASRGVYAVEDSTLPDLMREKGMLNNLA